MEDILQLRQKIYQLNQKRQALFESVLRPGKLLTASFYERMTKCSNPTASARPANSTGLSRGYTRT